MMPKHRLHFPLHAVLTMILGILACHAPARAQAPGQPAVGTPQTQTVPPPPSAAPVDRISMLDGNFLMQSADAHQAELELAALAQHRAAADGVRRLAAVLATDRSALLVQLRRLSQASGIQIMPIAGQSAIVRTDRLQRAQATDFDRMFLQQEGLQLDRLLALYKQEAEASTNPALRAFAAQVRPRLAQQQQQVQQMLAGL